MPNDENSLTRDTQPLPLPPLRDEAPEEPAGEALAESAVSGIPTPVPFVVPSDKLETGPRPQRSGSCGLWAVVILSLIISLASLSLNAVLIYRMLSVRDMAIEGLDAAIAAVDKLGGEGIHFEYHFQETIPLFGRHSHQAGPGLSFQGRHPDQHDSKGARQRRGSGSVCRRSAYQHYFSRGPRGPDLGRPDDPCRDRDPARYVKSWIGCCG